MFSGDLHHAWSEDHDYFHGCFTLIVTGPHWKHTLTYFFACRALTWINICIFGEQSLRDYASKCSTACKGRSNTWCLVRNPWSQVHCASSGLRWEKQENKSWRRWKRENERETKAVRRRDSVKLSKPNWQLLVPERHIMQMFP